MRRELTADQLSGADIGATINVQLPAWGLVVGMLVDVHHRGDILTDNVLCDPAEHVSIGRSKTVVQVYDGLDMDAYPLVPNQPVVLITK